MLQAKQLTAKIAALCLTMLLAATFLLVLPAPAHATGDDYREGSQTFGSGAVVGVGSTAGDRSLNNLVGIGGTQEVYRTEQNDPSTRLGGTRELLQITDKAYIPFGDGFELPLIKAGEHGGLIDLGSMGVGVAGSITWSDNPHHSFADSGLVDDNGVIALTVNDDGSYHTTNGNEYKPVRISVTDLLRQLVDVAPLWNDLLLNDVSVELGVGGSSAELSVDQGVQKLHSNYVVAGAKVVVDAPILKHVSTLLKTTVDGLDQYLSAGVLSILNDIPALGKLIKGVLEIKVDLPEVAVDNLLTLDVANDSFAYTWTDENQQTHTENVPAGLVSANIGTGQITIDLEKLHAGEGAGGAQGLNGLPPNTDLLRARDINLILAAVNRLLTSDKTSAGYSQSLLGTVEKAIDKILDETSAEINVLGLAGTPVIHIELNLGDPDQTSASLIGLPLLGWVLAPITEGLKLLVTNLVPNLVTPLLNSIISTVLQPLLVVLDPVLDGLSRVINIKLNRQMVKAGAPANYEYGTLHDLNDGFTARSSTTDSSAYNGESFSVAAAEIGLVNWSKDKSKSSAITVTLAESDVRVLPLSQAGKLSCETHDGETCYTLEAPSLFDPTNGTTLSSITYRGVAVPEKNIKVKESTGETTADGIAIQRIKFVPPAKPAGGWPVDENGNPSNKIIVTRTTPDGTGDPYMTTWFGTLEFDIPTREIRTEVTYTDAVVAPGTNGSPEVTLTADTPNTGDTLNSGYTFYGLDTGGVKALLGWALNDDLSAKETLTNLRGLITEADEAATAAAEATSATPTSTEAPTPDTTGTDTGTSTETTTSGPTEAEFATAIAGMPEFWTSTTPSLDLASTKARAAVALIDAILAKANNITVPEGGTKLSALKAQISAGTSVDASDGTVTASVPADQTGVIVPVMKMSTDCTISFAAARIIKAPDYLGNLPVTGGPGVKKFALGSFLLLLITGAATALLYGRARRGGMRA